MPLMAVHDMVAPSHPVDYGRITRSPLPGDRWQSCPGVSQTATDADTTTRGDPLPADALAQWHDLLRRLNHDTGAAVIVRRGAWCVSI